MRYPNALCNVVQDITPARGWNDDTTDYWRTIGLLQ